MDDPFPVDMLRWWQDFFKSMHPILPNGMNVYPEVFDAGFFPLQRIGETAEMMRLAKSVRPQVVMEIGTDKGGGLYHWCQCLPDVKKVIACEIRDTPYSKMFEAAFPNIKFCWLPTSSRSGEAQRAVQHFLNGDKIDCLFIDGDKSFFDADYYYYTPRMSEHGIVFFHDVTDPEPGAAFFRVVGATGLKWQVVLNTKDTQAAIQRERLGFAPGSSHEGWLRVWRGRSCGVGVIHLGEKMS